MKRNILVVSGSGFAVIALIAGSLWVDYFYGPGSDDSHRTNRQYILWKEGKSTHDPAIALRFMNVDSQFRISLRGKTKKEVQKWFPDLRPLDQANDYQRDYNHYVEDMDFLWIGGSQWGIEFHHGKLKEFHLMKG